MSLQLQAIVTILALINPVMCAVIFMRIGSTQPRAERVASAIKGALMVLVILVLAALVGSKVLHLFGISLDAFSVAGGGVLAWNSSSMLRGSSSDTNSSKADDADTHTSLTPLILFAASPGTITGVITLSVAHAKTALPVTALLRCVIDLRCSPEQNIAIHWSGIV